MTFEIVAEINGNNAKLETRLIEDYSPLELKCRFVNDIVHDSKKGIQREIASPKGASGGCWSAEEELPATD